MKSFDKTLLYDSRMLQRNIKDGKITNAEINKYRAALPDRAGEAENISIDSNEEIDSPDTGKESAE